MREKLIEIQRKSHLTDNIITDEVMANKLGITRTWWNYIKKGKKPMTDRIKRKGYEAFPEETRDIFLSDNYTRCVPTTPQNS